MIRARRPPRLETLARATRDEVATGRALLSIITATELLVGARDGAGAQSLQRLIEFLPVVAADREIAALAGRLGAHARRFGKTVPLPDLVIAATAIHLDVQLLTCDSDFGRFTIDSVAAGHADEGEWNRLRFHSASVVSPLSA
jgi:predicted nucleic acid-binding protein